MVASFNRTDVYKEQSNQSILSGLTEFLIFGQFEVRGCVPILTCPCPFKVQMKCFFLLNLKEHQKSGRSPFTVS